MRMIVGGGLFALTVLVLWVFCIFDVIATDETVMRNLPKIIWLLIVIFVPTIGSIAWLILGRPENAGWAPGGTGYRPPRPQRSPGTDRPWRKGSGVLAPDDDPRFLAELDERTKRLQAWEDELKRRDDELRKREEGDASA
jgi:hypothetical protein